MNPVVNEWKLSIARKSREIMGINFLLSVIEWIKLVSTLQIPSDYEDFILFYW